MKWEELIIKRCYEVLKVGGEVRIQFMLREYKGEKTAVPIIKVYPDNQIICDTVVKRNR